MFIFHNYDRNFPDIRQTSRVTLFVMSIIIGYLNTLPAACGAEELKEAN